MNDSYALVLSTDALTAALIGVLLETEGYRPMFPAPDETPRESLRRIRPGTVLVDCEQDTACSEAFLGPATMTGARVIMFSASRTREEVESFARRYGFDWFILPTDVSAFSQVIRSAPR